jgi:hypothetical protein
MFRGIFNKSGAGQKGKSQEAPLVPASANPAATEAQTFAQAKPVAIDEAMLVIGRELSGLAQLPVAQAARERGWAAVQRELERRPVVATGAKSTAPIRSARPAKARRLRWALASAAATVAVIAALVGTYSGGLLQTAGNDDPTGTVTSVTSVASSDTTGPSTPVTTESTTVSTVGPGTTQAPDTTVIQPSTTEGPGTTVTQPTTPTTSRPTRTTGGSSTTTRPGTTSTTGQQLYTSAQREGSARAAVAYLAQMVTSGSTSGASGLVAPEAQASLAQMVMTLSDPHGYKITGVQSLSDTIVRVTLQISDRVTGPNGEVNEVYSKFAIKVRVDDENGAIVIAIDAG